MTRACSWLLLPVGGFLSRGVLVRYWAGKNLTWYWQGWNTGPAHFHNAGHAPDHWLRWALEPLGFFSEGAGKP